MTIVVQARNLPMTDFFPGKCDPYVWVTLLPDRKQYFKTKVKKNMHHPHWCETFCFEGEFHKLLHLTVVTY